MGHTYLKCCNAEFFIYIAAVVFLVLCDDLMFRLTLGLMSMSVIDIEVLAKSGMPKDHLHACMCCPHIFISLYIHENISTLTSNKDKI